MAQPVQHCLQCKAAFVFLTERDPEGHILQLGSDTNDKRFCNMWCEKTWCDHKHEEILDAKKN